MMPDLLRMHGSLRQRLLVFTVLTVTFALLAAGGALVVVFENHLLRRVEQELGVRWGELAKAFELGDDGQPFLNRDLSDPRYLQPYGGAYWQVNSADHAILRSRSLWDTVLETRSVTSEKKARAFETEGPNASELYVVEREVTLNRADGPRNFALAVALDHAEVTELQRAFAADVTKVLALIALVLVMGSFLQLRYGLSPLKALRASLAEVRDGRARRLGGRHPAEIAPLIEDLNGLLDRQDDLVEKARNRAGSLAHGLKTPLTILAGEIARLGRDGHAERSEILRAQCEAIGAHIERELARARTHGAVRARGARTEIRPLAERLVDVMRRVDHAHRLDWAIHVPAGTFAPIEETDLAEILGNLLDNARKWARKSVRIDYFERDGEAFLAVADDGPGVPAHLKPNVLERGVHVGLAGEQSSGLGLAIVSDTLAEYGVTPSVLDGDPGCRVVFAIGAARPPPKMPAPQARSAPKGDRVKDAEKAPATAGGALRP